MVKLIAAFLTGLTLSSVAIGSEVSASQDIDHPKASPFQLSHELLEVSSRNDEVFHQAGKFIDAWKNEPTCTRRAVHTLIDSCKSIGSNSDHRSKAPIPDGDVALDKVKDEFAIRLALCELRGTEASLPEKCSKFLLVPCEKSRNWNYFANREAPTDEKCYQPLTEDEIDACRRALSSSTQSWISYSNARQNSVVVCQATRAAVEKDKLISMWSALNKGQADAIASLIQNLQSLSGFLKAQSDFFETKSAEMETSVDGFVSRLGKKAEAYFDVVASRFQSVVRQSDEAEKSMDRAADKAESLNDKLRSMQEDTTEMSVALKKGTSGAEVALTNLRQGIAVVTENTIPELRQALDSYVQTVGHAFEEFEERLEGANSKIDRLTGQLGEYTDSLSAFFSTWNAVTQLAFPIFALGACTFVAACVSRGLGGLVAWIGGTALYLFHFGLPSGMSQIATGAIINYRWIGGALVLVLFMAIFGIRYRITTRREDRQHELPLHTGDATGTKPTS
ncbi:hypothetical protein K402DRAFT_215693 [Aulographum hederae CBS 113979]|uniref:Nuclear membrane fusion protein Kar5 n=1 Tax=Aulographum hederae CBS 113979 TaxID=1176131 RepID=A0A6G1GMA2_9PEZI|nr:hypothetical protein K402DRAFT_215693 [Aulographum hederae CBS 113979]